MALRALSRLVTQPLSLTGPVLTSPAAIQVRWGKSKRKRKPAREMTPDVMATKAQEKQVGRIEDMANKELQTPYAIAKSIGQKMARLTDFGRSNIRKKRDFRKYNQYRFARLAGHTHLDEEQDAPEMTPLTRLQHESNLPRSTAHARFDFPHTFHTIAYWGPPSTYKNPNWAEGSMQQCSVCVSVDDLLELTPRQRERMVEIVGPDCFDETRNVVRLDADLFPERNQNAAYLGDQFQRLIEEAKKA
mmetsp:Transcript_9781/g.21299  ORF Transcript_9781/g.21299 Transcript_9781/m.21299 type:complete len:246 (-) Transcript_9781:87-824(-)